MSAWPEKDGLSGSVLGRIAPCSACAILSSDSMRSFARSSCALDSSRSRVRARTMLSRYSSRACTWRTMFWNTRTRVPSSSRLPATGSRVSGAKLSVSVSTSAAAVVSAVTGCTMRRAEMAAMIEPTAKAAAATMRPYFTWSANSRSRWSRSMWSTAAPVATPPRSRIGAAT